MIGNLAPQGIKVVVITVILRSRSLSIVRDAITPGIPQPVATSIGIKDLPESPNRLEDTVHNKSYPGHITAAF